MTRKYLYGLLFLILNCWGGCSRIEVVSIKEAAFEQEFFAVRTETNYLVIIPNEFVEVKSNKRIDESERLTICLKRK